jgi:hypothetical protein
MPSFVKVAELKKAPRGLGSGQGKVLAKEEHFIVGLSSALWCKGEALLLEIVNCGQTK